MNNNIENKYQQYGRVPVRPQYKRKKRPKRGGNSSRFFFFIILIVAAICFFVNYKVNFSEANNPTAKHSPLDLNFNFSPRRQNILLMGVDVAENSKHPFKGNRSDTMLLISIAPYGKNINVISIPRDSKVFIAGKDKPDKINHAFAFGGVKLAVKTVEESFGVKINNYLAISNDGVIKMIDILGGLPIYIEKNMKYDDYSANLHINLKKGEHVLSGKQTEGYLRFRHDSYGDIGRIRRQQWFFNALIARLKDPSVVVKLPELLKVLPQYIQTDMSGYDLAKYAGMAKNIDTSSIQIATIPGSPSTKGVISYWIIDPQKTQELMNRMVYRNRVEVNPADLSVGILYSSLQADKANELKQTLEGYGMKVKMREGSSSSKDYIAVHNLDIAGEALSELKKEIPELKDRHTVYDPIGINRAGKDLTIVISDL